jgi:hypothetical protein
MDENYTLAMGYFANFYFISSANCHSELHVHGTAATKWPLQVNLSKCEDVLANRHLIDIHCLKL